MGLRFELGRFDVVSFVVAYKYTTTMPIVRRDGAYFLESVSSKAKDFCEGRLELHVAPFYGLKVARKFAWQPIIDFDPKNLSEWRVLKKRALELVAGFEKEFLVELTGRGFHVVWRHAFGFLTQSEAGAVRRLLKRELPFADVYASVRFMPVRRYPSRARTEGFVVVLTPEEFEPLSRTEAEELMLKRRPPCDSARLKKEVLELVLPQRLYVLAQKGKALRVPPVFERVLGALKQIDEV